MSDGKTTLIATACSTPFSSRSQARRSEPTNRVTSAARRARESATKRLATKQATILALQPLTQLAAEFKLLYGNGSNDVRIEYVDSLHGLVPILVSAGSTFVHWQANLDKTVPKRYIQFADATLSLRIELPLFYFGKRGEVSTFIESFNGDTPIGKRTTEMIPKDELWSAGDVVSLKQQAGSPS